VPDPVDDRPLPGEDSRLYRIGVMLLNGYGHNWYRLDNQMRADDCWSGREPVSIWRAL
jgi:hypothetical protein